MQVALPAVLHTVIIDATTHRGAANARHFFSASDQGLALSILKLSTGLQTDSVDNEASSNRQPARVTPRFAAHGSTFARGNSSLTNQQLGALFRKLSTGL
ncbi:hypothetical protein [Pandoraea pnomenusa]|uniref:hypothetical protein n=1 Tax=Pandoraea pnomenusa TaxID=93220 RepID=UPI003341CC93